MKEGDIVLTPLPQANSKIKNRPAIFLRSMPPFGDLLVCGVSSQLHQHVPSFDEIIAPEDADYASSGLKAKSLIRLNFLATLPANSFIGSIGCISAERHRRLLERLAKHLCEK